MKQAEANLLGLERGEDYGTCDYCDEVWFYDGTGPAHCGECGNHDEHCICYKHPLADLSFFDPDEPKYSVKDMFDRMEQHEGHYVEVVRYGTHDLCYNRAIECVDCSEVIFDIDNPYIDEGPPPESPYAVDIDGKTYSLPNDDEEEGYYDGVYPNGMTVVGYPDRVGCPNAESERNRTVPVQTANEGEARTNPQTFQYSVGPCDCSG